MGYYEIDKASPVAEVVEKLAGPPADGIAYTPSFWIKGPLAPGAANAFAAALQNPFGTDLLIVRAIVDVTAAGGRAASVGDLDVVNLATATGDDILDGIDLNAAAVYDSLKTSDRGTNGEGGAWKWERRGGTRDHVTLKILAQGANLLAGSLYLECIPAE